jgi:hypothetical protein
MTRLKRSAERIRERAAEGSLEGLPAWNPEHSEVGCTKGRLRREIFSVFFRQRKDHHTTDFLVVRYMLARDVCL